jgi:SpoVK/Ycf46/Vps4 family AAA+-type ATPase
LDEFDAIAKYRDDSKEVGEIKRVVNTLLQRLDIRQNKGVVIATTNHEKLLDPAVWRRFQNRILISEPKKEVRQNIITAYLKPLVLLEHEKQFLSLMLEGTTPAEIKDCINFIKRFTIINEEDTVSLYKAVRAYFVVNANNQTELSLCMSNENEHKLAELLVSKHGYSIQDVSNLVGKHKSTVSRWLKG